MFQLKNTTFAIVSALVLSCAATAAVATTVPSNRQSAVDCATVTSSADVVARRGRGADDGSGHIRGGGRGRGADDGVGHAILNGQGDQALQIARRGADDGAGHVSGGGRGRGRGASDGAGHA